MRGAILPAALLCAALGLMLGFVSTRVAAIGVAILVVVALVTSRVSVPVEMTEGVFLACWGSAVAIVACVYFPRPVPDLVAWLLAGIAGVCAGLVITTEATTLDLAKALPGVLIVVPSALAVRMGQRIAPRVVASWLIAVSLLAAIIPLTTVHPGYVPDHME